MRRIKKAAQLVLLLAGIGMVNGCVSIAEYQKMYLNDQDMVLSDDLMQTFESNFQTYREGASGANGGKSGGGCGCN